MIKAGEAEMTRRVDMRWREAAPAEIRFTARSNREKPPRILKRNYLGVESAYTLDYFQHSEDNLNLDDVNNHITESYVGVVSRDYGIAVAMDTTVQADFAFAHPPMVVSLNSDTHDTRPPPAPLEKPIGLSAEYHDDTVHHRIQPGTDPRHPKIPVDLKIRVLWSNVRAMLNERLQGS